jgi:hypothetical protein
MFSRPVTLFDACLRYCDQVNGELSMPQPKQEQWRELCHMAILESDPRRLSELFQQIDQLLSDVEDRPEPHTSQPLRDAS